MPRGRLGFNGLRTLELGALIYGIVHRGRRRHFLFAGGEQQNRLPLLPRADPTMGWKDHVRERYGSAFMDCFGKAKKDACGRVYCVLDVRAK